MAKRKLKKKYKVVFWLLALIIIFTGGYLVISKTALKDNFLNKTNAPNKDNETKENESYPKTYKASLIATGDGLLHNAVYLDAYDKATNTFDFKPQLQFVKDIISKYDIAYYNQETVFGKPEGELLTRFPADSVNIAGYVSYPYFNSPSAFGDDMVDIGFNLVSLASNHSADCTNLTDKCVTDSYNFWQNKDIVFAGFKPTPETDSSENYIIAEANGITYTLLNYTTSLNGLNGYNSSKLINEFDEEQVKKDIEAVRDKVDVLIVAMHWHTGAEYSFEVTEENRKIATFLANNGVDLVLGTYSHCLQPFEWIDDTLVYYSLGNFISNQGDLIDNIGYKGIVGVLATLDITKTVQKDGTSSIKIDNLGADLTYTYNNNHHDYRVIPFSKMSAEYNPDYLKIYEQYKEVFTSLDKNINIVPVNTGI